MPRYLMIDISRQLWNFYDALYLAWKWGSNPAKPEKKMPHTKQGII